MTELSAYVTGMSRAHIEEALRAAGKDPFAIEPADLASLEDFHTLGRLATRQLADLVRICSDDRVLDAGTGIGGTARFLAAEYGCAVTGVDLTDEYCATARWLNDSAGLSDRVTIAQGDVTDLRFADGTFDVVLSQHVQMNIADKTALYAEAYRVLAPGGRLAMWDITGTADQVSYPVPWAVDPADSHLVTSDRLRTVVEKAGFRIAAWNDLTQPTAQIMAAVFAQPPDPLGLQVFVPDFAAKVANIVRGFHDGWLQVIQAVAVRPARAAA
jgi:cyclopropane fatty-acyl-phospholipid synthase-like methyltransferase